MPNNTTNWDLKSQVLGAQESLVSPTAPEPEKKADRIVMQQFSGDE